MGPVAITFCSALALSFSLLLLLMRPQSTSKAARLRLVTIQKSVRIPDAVAFWDDLGAAERSSFAYRLGLLLERYRFSRSLKVLLIHAGSDMSVGDTVLLSAGTGLGAGLACFFFSHLLPLAAAATATGGAIPCLVLRIKRPTAICTLE